MFQGMAQRVMEIVGGSKNEAYSPRTTGFIERLLPILEIYSYTSNDIKELCVSCNYENEAIQARVNQILEQKQKADDDGWGEVKGKKKEKGGSRTEKGPGS